MLHRQRIVTILTFLAISIIGAVCLVPISPAAAEALAQRDTPAAVRTPLATAHSPQHSDHVRTRGVDGAIANNLAEAKWIAAANALTGHVLKPAGTNNPDCRVDDAHPYPLVLLHGTESTFFEDYSALGAALAADGWCVYGVDYGLGPTPADGFGWTSLKHSAAQVETVVRAAQGTSGSNRVGLIGFSQGAMLARVWMKEFAHAREVELYLGIAAPTRGGSFYGAARAVAAMPPALREAIVSPALQELIVGSQLMADMADESDLQHARRAYSVGTRVDEMMPELHNQPLRTRPGSHVWVQDVCPQDLSGHMYLSYNPTVLGIVRALVGEPLPVRGAAFAATATSVTTPSVAMPSATTPGVMPDGVFAVGGGEVDGRGLEADRVDAMSIVKNAAAEGIVPCAAVPLGYVIPAISFVDNLRKLGVLPVLRQEVVYELP